MSQKTKLAFIASIVVNVLLLGFLVGQSPRRFDRSALREKRMEQAIKDLPTASQTRLRDRFLQLRAAAEPLFGQMRQVQDESVRLLSVEPFDEAAFDGQQAKINKLRAETTKKLSDAVKNAVKDLKPEERRRFAELLRRPPPPGES
ncbi:MAG: periplasmic heavy metal sensor [Candidatus Binatia bacterium]